MFTRLIQTFQKFNWIVTLILSAGFLYLLLARPKPEAENQKSLPVESVKSTGKIAFVKLQLLNDSCLEIQEIVTKAKQEKSRIENQFNMLSNSYRLKLEAYQNSIKAGIESDANLKSKAEEIQAIELQAQQVQKQMENLELDIRQKNDAFLSRVKTFVADWCKGRYDYVLTYSDDVPLLLYGNPAADISKAVINQLNSNYKNLK